MNTADPPLGRIVAAALVLMLVVPAAPVQAHGGTTRWTKTDGPYNVTFHTSNSVFGGETMVVAWTVLETRGNDTRYFDGNLTVEVVHRDEDNRTLQSRTDPAERSRQAGGGAFYSLQVTFPEATRWTSYTVTIPNASVTFTQAVEPPPDSGGGDEPETTPLPGAVAVAAVAVAWWLRRD